MKIKCDEQRPACGCCSRKQIECAYEFPFVMYNPHLRKKSKNASKVNKSGVRVKTEDRRPQLSVPTEYTFISEKKFSDDSSSPCSEDSPKTVETLTNEANKPTSKENDDWDNLNTFTESSETLLSAVHPINAANPVQNPNDPSIKLEDLDFGLDLPIDLDFHFNMTPHLETIPSASLPPFSFDFYTVSTAEYTINYFRMAQPIIEKLGLTPEDPELRNMLWLYFTRTKILSNHLFVYDDFDQNSLVTWLMNLAKSPANTIILTLVIAALAAAIAFYTKLPYWTSVKERYLAITLKLFLQNILREPNFIEQTGLLFTVLLLYLGRSVTDSPVRWLRGAAGIYVRIISRWDTNILRSDTSNPQLESALGLFHFCECWYLLAESMAWISSTAGGLLPCSSIGDVSYARRVLLQHLGYETSSAIVLDGFNTIRFYPQVYVDIMNDIVCHIMELKVQGIDVSDVKGFLQTGPPTPKLHSLGNSLLQRLDAALAAAQQHFLHFDDCTDVNLSKTMRLTAACFEMGIRGYIYSTFLGYLIYLQEVQCLIPRFLDAYYAIPYKSSCALALHWPGFFFACCTPKGAIRNQIIQPLQQMQSHMLYSVHSSLIRVKNVWNFFDGTVGIDTVRKIDSVCF